MTRREGVGGERERDRQMKGRERKTGRVER